MKIAILTTFRDFPPGYSLTGIVKDQVRMLASFGNDVHLFVSEKFYGKGEAAPNIDHEKYGIDPSKVHVRMEMPNTDQIDYRSKTEITPEHQELVKRITKFYVDKLSDFDVIFTHDLIFQGWYMPYGLAIMEASKSMPKARWMHWIHSIPSVHRDWWNIREYGANHKIIYPNETDIQLISEQFRGDTGYVRSIPHIKDIRQWFGFTAETCKFFRAYPSALQADVFKVYPASVDRLSAKRVNHVIDIIANIKRKHLSVCLIIAAQHATGKQQREDISQYEKMAEARGLIPNKELIFTNNFDTSVDKNGNLVAPYGTGIPQTMIRDLFLCSNLFIFPTREETFGLVLPEAALSGVLVVANKSLRMLYEVSGGRALFFDFGSYHHRFVDPDMQGYLEDIASVIVGTMLRDSSIQAKTFSRIQYNWDALYHRFYLPTMKEVIGK